LRAMKFRIGALLAVAAVLGVDLRVARAGGA
jgi:hypothetical protein